MRGLGNMRVWREIDQATQRLTAFHTHMLAWDSERTIYMDGRAHPPEYANHTWQGFSTAVWEGNMLTVTTTHLKENYIRRNGVPRSDQATVTEHWMRHGDYLTVVTVIDDPVFLTEPLVRSDNWYLDPGQHIGIFGCEHAPELPKPEGVVPNHLPGTNPYLARDLGMVWIAVRSDSRRRGDAVSGVSAEAERLQAAAQVRSLLHVYDAVRLQLAMKLLTIAMVVCGSACAQAPQETFTCFRCRATCP